MSNSNDLKPYPHQQETINNLNREFKKGNTKQLVVLPSGSGKTHTIAFHVKKLKPKTFLYIVHRNEILYQTIKVFKQTIPWLKDEYIGIINQENKDYEKPYLFATTQTLSRMNNLSKLQKKEKKNNKTIEYVVIDEYHHVATPSYKRLIKYVKPKYLIGLTATPYRLDEKDIFSFVDNNIANSIDLFEAISKKILVPFHYIGLHDDIDYTQIKFNGYQYNTGDLDRKLIIHKRDDAVIDEYFKKIDSHKNRRQSTIIFCNSVEHIKRMADRFNNEGVKAAGIWHKQDIKVKRNIIELFRQGHYKVLLTRDILNEGVDFPECSALMFLRPTISKTIFFQQLGRGLRKKRGKKDVLVLDFVGNYHKAFEKRHWFLANNSKIELKQYSGKYIKPVYEYDHPKPLIEFDTKVIEIMDIQKRHYNDFVPRGSRFTANEKELINNYYNVKKYWLSLKDRKPNHQHSLVNDVPGVKLFYNRNVSKYSEICYELKYGNYHSFLEKIGEIEKIDENHWRITRWDSDEIKLKKLKKCVKILQKKLGRKYFNTGDWDREFKDNGVSFITLKMGGWKEFYKMFNIPKGLESYCVICGKKYLKTRYIIDQNFIKYCSIKCKNTYRLHHDPRYLKKLADQKEEKLKIMINCFNCNNPMTKYQLSGKKSRLQIRKFCSYKCRKRYNGKIERMRKREKRLNNQIRIHN